MPPLMTVKPIVKFAWKESLRHFEYITNNSQKEAEIHEIDSIVYIIKVIRWKLIQFGNLQDSKVKCRNNAKGSC